MTARPSEPARQAVLRAAQDKALALFDAIEQAQLIMPGRTERQVEDDIYAVAADAFGISRHWHKRIVRAGPNTLTIAADNPPVRTIGPDDIVYVDLGPVIGEWEADVGRSYALGTDPAKHKLVADLPRAFTHVAAHYHASPQITGSQLFTYAQTVAETLGWRFGGLIAGHIISEFAHAHIPGDKTLNRISPDNPRPMREPDSFGRDRHWILEIHLVDEDRTFGGFYERLL